MRCPKATLASLLRSCPPGVRFSTRARCSRLSRCDGMNAITGEMIHIDIKKLGRFNKIGHRIAGDRTGQSHNRGVGWELRADWSAMVWKLPGKDAQSLVTEPRVRRPPWNLDAGTMAHVS
jgi:hypothetical protein